MSGTKGWTSGTDSGRGPAGLATLRNLVQLSRFDCVKLVEKRDNIGGVWYLDDPDLAIDEGNQRPRWPSPAYPGLVGNVLPEYLSFAGFPFPEPQTAPDEPFPSLQETQAYLQAFAKPFLDNGSIRLNVEVTRVEELPGEAGWNVVMKDWNEGLEGGEIMERWDAVVVCVGWHDSPSWPDIDGLEELRHKGLALHAKRWRGAEGFENKRALVIENQNATVDMATSLSRLCQTPIYRNVLHTNSIARLDDSRIEDILHVKHVRSRLGASYTQHQIDFGTIQEESDKIVVTLEDGTEIEEIDVVFVDTGYRPHADIVSVFVPNDATQSLVPLPSLIAPTDTHHRIPCLYRHILYTYNPTLAFIGAATASLPFVIADLSSLWLALTWNGEIPLPRTPDDRMLYERELLVEIESKHRDEMGRGVPSSSTYSTLGERETQFAADLRRDVVLARPEKGKVLLQWDEGLEKAKKGMFSAKLRALEWAKIKRSMIVCEGNGIPLSD
ncbi:hypothetical protein D9758_005588 [Tetrapyrgos nigripes]|uniref:FAD/NAD(P)-binding domain-containing protein n=1 Tax=Tetrapyrgos nigripes TaxID=182062 RepID=A0A8H5GGM7_9AGAR|nr:hypothetical protein D9758_005588 [Tetrapyrgos nigripes]